VELVQSQDVDIVNEQGDNKSDTFLEEVEQLRKENPAAGICWRWMIAVADNGEDLELTIQALPCTLHIISASPLLKLDTAPAIVVAR
jgi:hypothetical protein